MKKIVILLLLITGKSLGQGVRSELYQYNYGLIHPAFAGNQGQRISILGNTTAYGTSDVSKRTAFIMSYENYFEKINSGVAVTGYSERAGASSLSSLALSYSYRITLSESSMLVTSVRTGTHYQSFSYIGYSTPPSDQPLDLNLSASNWTADFGVLFKMKEFYFGALTNNFAHSSAKLDLINWPDPLTNNYAVIIGTSFTLSEHLVSQHSLYVPFEDDEYRVDLNNTLTINDLFLLGLSVERSNDKFFARANAGVKVKDYFEILFLLYSGKRNEFTTPEFRGEVFLAVGF